MNNNIALSALVLAGVVLPPSGDDVYIEVTGPELATVEEDLSGRPVFNIEPRGSWTLTINCRPNSVTHFNLRHLVARWKASKGQMPLPGSAQRMGSADAISWGRAVFTQEPNFVQAKTSPVVTCTLALAEVNITSLPPPVTFAGVVG